MMTRLNIYIYMMCRIEILESEDGFEEEYPLEDISITPADMIARVHVPADFRSAWEHLGAEFEVREQYLLGNFKTLDAGVSGVLAQLGLQPCERSDVVSKGASSHIMLLSGVFIGGIKVLVKSKLSFQATTNTTSPQMLLQMAVRSEDPDISQLVSDCIQ